MIGQSKKYSALESIVNVLIGYGIAITAQVIIFPWFGINVPMHSHLVIGGVFTVVSLVRSYCLRRAFNWWHLRGWNKACALGNAECRHGVPYRYPCVACDNVADDSIEKDID